MDTPIPRPSQVDPTLRHEAVRRLHARRGFRTHLVVFVLVNLLLVGVWLGRGLSGGSWTPWPVVPLLSWGVGLAMHAWAVFGRQDLSEDRIRQEVDRLTGQ